VQHFTVRMITSSYVGKDARKFIIDNMCSLTGTSAIVDRPIHVVGFKASYPPTDDAHNSFEVRIESFARDSRYLFIENQATFLEPVAPGDTAHILANLQKTKDFITNNVTRFLEQFEQAKQ